MRPLAFVTALALALPAYAPPPVPGSGAAVDLPISTDATVVLQLDGWERARGRLDALVAKAVPDDAKAVKEWIEIQLSTVLEGRTWKGLDPDARVFVAINDLHGVTGETSPLDVFVPVKDATAFQNAFFKDDERRDAVKKANGVTAIALDGTTFYMVDKAPHLILTSSESRANVYAGKYELFNTKRMGPDVAATFLAADIALYVDLEKVNEQFGEEIRQFRSLIDFAFQNAGGAVPGLDKSQLDASKEMLKGVFQVLEDGRSLVVATEFRPEGLNLRVQGRFAAGSKTGKVLSAETPDAHTGVVKLPQGFSEYRGSRFGPTVSGLLDKVVQEFAATDTQDSARSAIDDYRNARTAAGPKGTRGGSLNPDRALLSEGFRDPAAALSAQLKLLQTLPAGTLHGGIVLKQKPSVKEGAVEYKGQKYSEVTIAYDLEETLKKLPEPAREAARASLKSTTKEKVRFWLGTGTEAVIRVTAPDWPVAQKLLDGFVNYGQENKPLVATRGQLPAEVSYLALLDAGHLVHSVSDQLGTFGQSIPGLPFELPKIRKVTAAPTFVGIAVVLKPEIGQFDLFLPADALGVMRKSVADQ